MMWHAPQNSYFCGKDFVAHHPCATEYEYWCATNEVFPTSVLMGVQWYRGMQPPLLRRSRTRTSSTIDGGGMPGGGHLPGCLGGDLGRRGTATMSQYDGKGGV
jgi:hypothetical protein